jgi:hypothetical protein
MTKLAILSGIFVLTVIIGMSPSFADSNITVLSTNNGIQITETVIPMSIPSDNTLPWAYISGVAENQLDDHPVILQIYQNDEPIHFAQTNVNEDGTYEYKFRVKNIDGDKAVNVFEGDYTVKIFKSVQVTGSLNIV